MGGVGGGVFGCYGGFGGGGLIGAYLGTYGGMVILGRWERGIGYGEEDVFVCTFNV